MLTNHKYSKDIQEYLDTVKQTLINNYGYWDDTWMIHLSMLGDNLQIYENCWNSVNENGVYSEETKLKNPLLSTLKDSYATVLKISQKLGISPWDLSKIKAPEEDDSDEFLEHLKS